MLNSCWGSLIEQQEGCGLISLQAFEKWSSHPKTDGFQCRGTVRIYVLLLTGCCNGKQYAVVKFQCTVTESHSPPRDLLGKGDLQTETNGKV